MVIMKHQPGGGAGVLTDLQNINQLQRASCQLHLTVFKSLTALYTVA